MSEYTEKADQFLKEHGISFSVLMKADRCPMWCKGDCVHGDRYLVTFKRNSTKQKFSLSFWNSVNDMHAGKAPTAYDVLAAIQKYDPGDFKEFCGEFGYSTDSVEAHNVHKAVVKEWQKAAKFFSLSELAEAQDIQ